MALIQANVPRVPVKEGGGMFSKIAGGLSGLTMVGGLVAAPFTAGTSIPAAAGIAGGIGGVGAAGGALDQPTQSGGGEASVPLSAPDRRLQGDPRAVIATLNESISALQRQDQKTRSAYEPFLMAAKQAAESRMA